MEDRRESVSYFVLEGIMTHFSTVIKRLTIIMIVILALWAATIAGFIWYISLPVEECETVEDEMGTVTADITKAQDGAEVVTATTEATKEAIAGMNILTSTDLNT